MQTQMQMRDVHEFDGKFNIEKIVRGTVEKEEECYRTFALREMPMRARHMLVDIYSGGAQKNHDPVNRYHARDLLMALLYRISILKDDEDRETMQMLLEEQLQDMALLGPCPQGRVVRLWQLYHSISEASVK